MISGKFTVMVCWLCFSHANFDTFSFLQLTAQQGLSFPAAQLRAS